MGLFGAWLGCHVFMAAKFPVFGRHTMLLTRNRGMSLSWTRNASSSTTAPVGSARSNATLQARSEVWSRLSKTPSSASAFREFEWCKSRHKLILTPVKGFGNRMRALIAAHYIALLTGRELVVVWPGFESFMRPNASRCVKWVERPEAQPCTMMDCSVYAARCVGMFNTRSMNELFPDRERCIHLVSYTAWDLYLLDNAATHGAVLSITQKIPPSVILGSVTLGLTSDVWHVYSTYRALMANSTAARHIMISLHIRTGADRDDGGVIQNLFMPQLRCACLLQDHLSGLNITSSVFIESDSIHVKNVAATMRLKNVIVLGSHAERANLKYTIVLWLLLGDGDIFLGAHTSSLSRTAAQRTGTMLYQLPHHKTFGVATPAGERTLQCVRDPVHSTKTHDTVYILTPSECADVYPACPAMSVNVLL